MPAPMQPSPNLVGSPEAAPAAAGAVAPAARSISVVIPVHDRATILRPLVERPAPVLRAASDAYELVLVNDGSHDGSWQVVEQLTREHAWVRGIDLMRNYGQHNALLCGIRAARHATIVTIDDDLQHPPEEIP